MVLCLQDDLFRRARASGHKYSPAAKKEIADFGSVYHQLRWDINFVGVQVSTVGKTMSCINSFQRCCRAYAPSNRFYGFGIAGQQALWLITTI